MGYIYKIENVTNGKIYIGQTTRTVECRWNCHIREAYSSSKSDRKSKFHNAIRKYGQDKFVVTTIEECDDNLLNEQEIFLIAQCDTFNTPHGYNCTSDGDRFIMSDESRQKIGDSKCGENNHYYGKNLSAEHRRKISEAQRGERGNKYGKSHTEESLLKIKTTESVPIVGYSDDNIIYKYYLSATSANTVDSIDACHIRSCISGKRGHSNRTPDGTLLCWRNATPQESSVIKEYFIKTGIESISVSEYTKVKEAYHNAKWNTQV